VPAAEAERWADTVTNLRGKFRIENTFDHKSRGMLMVIGDVITGKVRPGDVASAGETSFPIALIEMLCRRDRTCGVALGFRYTDEEQLARLNAFASSVTELDLVPPSER
jgi:hypothetical protein